MKVNVVIIRKLQKSYKIYLFIYFYSASSGAIPPNMDKLAVGFSTTEIRLWGINETVLIKPKYEEPSFTFASDIPFLHKFYDTSDGM